MAAANLLHIFGLYPGFTSGPLTASNNLVDASDEGIGWVFQCPFTEAITHVGWRYGVRTGTPPTFITGLEGVSVTTGLPDGTYLGGGSPASVTFTPPADATIDGLWQWKALTNSYTPASRAEEMALTVRYSSGTIDASNNSSFTRTAATTGVGGDGVFGLPYSVVLAAGAWSKPATADDAMVFGIRTASGRYGIFWQSQYTTTTSTAGNRQTMRFTLPAGHGDTFKVVGARSAYLPAAGTVKFGLWSGTTEIQAKTVDADQLMSPTTQRIQQFFFSDATLDALSFGTEYRIGFEVISGAIGLRGHQLSEANDRLMFPYGDIRGLSTWDGAAWTDDDTVLPDMELIFDDITEPVAAAGGGGGFIIGG